MITDLSIPLVHRIVPKTSKTRYIGGYCSLNLSMPDTSGDWHQPDYIYCRADRPPLELMVFGEGVDNYRNTNHIFDNYGIVEYSQTFKDWGFKPEYPEVYRSNHFRAILDLLYIDFMKYPLDSHIPFATQEATEDFLDTEEQKQEVLNKAQLIKPHLPQKRRFLLDRWMNIEKMCSR